MGLSIIIPMSDCSTTPNALRILVEKGLLEVIEGILMALTGTESWGTMEQNKTRQLITASQAIMLSRDVV